MASTAAAGLIAVPALTLALLVNFDWNRARPWLDARVSEALGRPVVIAGTLTLHWQAQRTGPASWRGMIPWPHWVAQDIHIGNPPDMALPGAGAEAPPLATEMARIKGLSFSLNPLALLDKRLVIPVLSFASPTVSLRRDADGRNNWSFRNALGPSPWKLEVQRVIMSRGSVHLSDAIRHADLTADLDSVAADPVYGLAWQLRGRLNGRQVTGAGKAGAVLSLQHQTTPYPISAALHVGSTVIAVAGTLLRPTDLAALDLQLQVSGVSMARLYALSGIVMPETPPYTTRGHLIGTLGPRGNLWRYQQFSGRVGSSLISGNLDYQSQQPRPLLSGVVVSQRLRFSDLASLIGADSNASKTRRGGAAVQPANKLLPVERFKTERWTSIDADIDFRADRIIHNADLPIDKLTTHLHLRDGVLSLSPLKLDLAGGSLSANISLDGSGRAGKNAIKAKMKVTARQVRLKQLFPGLRALRASAGEINGDAKLSATGDSVASLLGAANGEVKTLINQGTVSKLLLEEMGLNIGNVILTRLAGDRQVKLNCLAADFGVSAGVMHSHSFIIDTDDAILDVTGDIDLAREQVNLVIDPKSKGLRVLSLRAPLYVRGSFKEPRLSIDKGVLAMRAGGALALAALLPAAALIPLIKTGPEDSSDCSGLLAAARVKPVAPPPGKTYHGRRK
ncbi:putative assembly protein [mine drainage metagenome]|uniref:Putative assembly protein n=1 Tax=mine drainage metagenome TaxID=410659 RepID=A0A1J5R901_9ZZZZ